MALKQDMIFKSIPIAEAYHKIVSTETFDEIITDEEGQESKAYKASVWFASYPNAEKAEELERNPHLFTITNPDEIKIIEDYLTLLYSKVKGPGEEFENAIDC